MGMQVFGVRRGVGRWVLGALLFAICGVAAASGKPLSLKSSAVLVVDQTTGETLEAKNADAIVPIASLTKLMTALVVLDAKLPPDEMLEITKDDISHDKPTPSRLKVGSKLRRDDLLLLALMASENRAAMALSRNYPGGRAAFIGAMNAKALSLGMNNTHFEDPAGLSRRSVSTARDLQKLVSVASGQPTIRDYSTRREHTVHVANHRMRFTNSNRLVRYSSSWDIQMQKTGFTNEAGRCLIMVANVSNRKLAMIFLNSVGKLTRYGDARRVAQRIQASDRKHATPIAATP